MEQAIRLATGNRGNTKSCKQLRLEEGNKLRYVADTRHGWEWSGERRLQSLPLAWAERFHQARNYLGVTLRQL
jgi:hypothetical protein